QDAAEIVRKLALALQKVHDAGLVHRDIKPSNVMIDESGEPLLMDFGLARQTQIDRDARQITTTGSLLGTPAYMSPEQASGEQSSVNSLSDIYSLGVLLYQLITGRLPFTGTLTQVLLSITQSEPPAPRSVHPELDAELETICLKAMSKRPADRYQSGSEF